MSAVYPESPLSSPPATVTPGQAAYEASVAVMAGDFEHPPWRWDQLPPKHRQGWDAAAQAAIARYIEVNGRDPVDARALIAEVLSEQAAPELTAALAETRTIRDGYRGLCEEFAPSPQSGMSARISLTSLNRHLRAAGLAELPRTAASGDREDITMRYRRERDEAREQLAVLRATVAEFTRVWSDLLPNLPDDYACHMKCAEANTAADLFQAAGADADAAAIIAAHVCDADDKADVHGEADGG